MLTVDIPLTPVSRNPDEAEQRLRSDRRLLGSLLGDVIREQTGPVTLAEIEYIRRAAVELRRGKPRGLQDTPMVEARTLLEKTLDGLSADETLHVVRAFSYFLHLVNIAENT